MRNSLVLPLRHSADSELFSITDATIECVHTLHIYNVHFKNVIFYKCDLRKVEFNNCTFDGVLFQECDLWASRFESSEEMRVRFSDCEMGMSTIIARFTYLEIANCRVYSAHVQSSTICKNHTEEFEYSFDMTIANTNMHDVMFENCKIRSLHAIDSVIRAKLPFSYISSAYMEEGSHVIYPSNQDDAPRLGNVNWRFSEQLGEVSGYIYLI